MIARRTLLAGATCLGAIHPTAAALPIRRGNRLAFDIVRKGSKIGSHVLTFQPEANRLIVRIAADIAVAFGPIVLFRYKHRATERWEDGRVVSLDADTDDDGEKFAVKIRRDGDALAVEANGKPRYIAPPNTTPATHWNRGMLDGPFVNTQDGKLLRPSVISLGTTTDLPRCPIPASGFALRGDCDLDTWYDTAPRWVGLRFKGRDGTEIRYELA
ncbi:MAG: DUF6134 family protein [Rhodospirillales bacterium]